MSGSGKEFIVWVVCVLACGFVAASAIFGLNALGVFTAVGETGGGLIGLGLGVLALLCAFGLTMWWLR